MTAAPVERPGLPGPFLTTRTPGTRTWGPTGRAVLEAAGRTLLPWQADYLDQLLEVDADGRLTRRDAALLVPRRNGKTLGPIVARILAGVLVLGERHVLYTAHEAETARQTWVDLTELLGGSLADELRPVLRRGRGSESIELTGVGAVIDFRTRTAHSGRGRETDLLILDEALRLNDDQVAALLPLTAAARSRGRGQVIVASSAGQDDALPLLRAALRGRAAAGTPGDGLAYAEYAVPRDADPADPAVWHAANPSLGSAFLSVDTLAGFAATMAPEDFGRECLGWWPANATAAVAPGLWAAALEDGVSLQRDWPAVLGVDVSHGRDAAAVVLAARDPAGVIHLRLLATATAERGGYVDTADLAGHLVRLRQDTGAGTVAGDGWTTRPVLDTVAASRVPVTPLPAAAMALATAGLVTGIASGRIRHDGDQVLTEHVLAAGTKPAGDGGVVLSRLRSAGPIAAAVAAAAAVRALDAPAAPVARIHIARRA